MKIKLVIFISFLMSGLYVSESKAMDQMLGAFGGLGIEQSQVDQLVDMFGSLSVDKNPQKITLIAFLMKVIINDSQQKSSGDAFIKVMELREKKMEGQVFKESDITDLARALKQGEPDLIRKRVAEDMLFKAMDLSKSREGQAIKTQLESWRSTPCEDIAKVTPGLPLELMFSSEIDCSEPMEVD